MVNGIMLIAVYYAIGTLGMMMAVAPGNVTPIYPAAGLAWALALIYGKRALPIVFFGGLLSNLVPIFSNEKVISAVFTGIAIGIGEVISVFVACYVLKKLTSKDFQFRLPLEVFSFSMISIFWIISPTVGVSALFVGGFVTSSEYWFVWCTWWLGDSIGILLTTPLLICIYQQKSKNQTIVDNRYITALTCLLSLTLAVLIFSFSFPVAYLLTLVTLLSCFWLDQRSILIVNLVIATVATYATLSGKGPFIVGSPMLNLLILQLFIAVNVVISQIFWSKLVQIKELGSSLQAARFEARKDSLTNILNRRGFDERTHQQYFKPDHAAALILDIDDFKKVNDTYGHDVGDEVLRHLTEVINQCIRNSDIFARIGGEEFSIYMENTDVNEANNLATRICEAVASSKINHGELELTITVSIGVTEAMVGESVEDTLHRADKLLYQAKVSGKNRVVCG